MSDDERQLNPYEPSHTTNWTQQAKSTTNYSAWPYRFLAVAFGIACGVLIAGCVLLVLSAFSL
jgi:hypothetical protein